MADRGDRVVIGHDGAVLHVKDARGLRSDVKIVGDHDDGLAVVVQLADQPEHLLTGGRIERAGRLVGEQQGRQDPRRARATATRCWIAPGDALAANRTPSLFFEANLLLLQAKAKSGRARRRLVG
jgi:hypothetical protein